jgi:hypothetical protein
MRIYWFPFVVLNVCSNLTNKLLDILRCTAFILRNSQIKSTLFTYKGGYRILCRLNTIGCTWMITHQRFFAEFQASRTVKLVSRTTNTSVKVLTAFWIRKETVVCRITCEVLLWFSKWCRRCCYSGNGPICKTEWTFR